MWVQHLIIVLFQHLRQVVLVVDHTSSIRVDVMNIVDNMLVQRKGVGIMTEDPRMHSTCIFSLFNVLLLLLLLF